MEHTERKPDSEGAEEAKAFCFPRDEKPMWMLMFADTERGNALYANEQDARDAYDVACLNWNCYLFAPASRLPASSEASTVITEGQELCCCGHREMFHANYMNWPRKCNQTGCDCTDFRPAPSPESKDDPLEGFEEWIRTERPALWMRLCADDREAEQTMRELEAAWLACYARLRGK